MDKYEFHAKTNDDGSIMIQGKATTRELADILISQLEALKTAFQEPRK